MKIMSKTLLREPGYYGRPLLERQAWQLYGKAKFPNYDRFWQAFVVPRIRPTAPYIKFLGDVSHVERRIIRLHQVIFRLFNNVYDYKPYTGYRAEWHEEGNFLFSLNALSSICDDVEELILLLLAVSGKALEQQASAKQYVLRLYDRRAKIVAMHVPGKRYSLSDLPKDPPPVTILPSELKLIRTAYDLHDYSPVAKQIRAYRKAVDTLDTFNIDRFMPSHDPLRPITEADAAALQSILGNYSSMHELVVDQADQLLPVIDDLYGKQLISLIK